MNFFQKLFSKNQAGENQGITMRRFYSGGKSFGCGKTPNATA